MIEILVPDFRGRITQALEKLKIIRQMSLTII